MNANSILLWLLALCAAWTIAMGIHRRRPYRSVVSLLLLAYLYALIIATQPVSIGPFRGFGVTPEGAPLLNVGRLAERRKGVEYNLVPFHWLDMYPVGSGNFYRQIVGNVLMFMPFSFLLAARDPVRARLWKVVPIALLLSIAVEVAQYAVSVFFGETVRYADIDDVILNTAGGVLGYLAFLPLRKPLQRLHAGDAPRR